jgi:hypothetical protein
LSEHPTHSAPTGSHRPLPRATAVRRSNRYLAGSALLILLGILLAIIISEAMVRMLGLGRPEFDTFSATRGWKLLAGASGWQTEEGRAYVSVNRWGYRGPEWTRTKPPGTLRIAVLGDSFVEAQQVAEQNTACALIQQELSSQLSSFEPHHPLKRVEVMNFGVDGYGTAQEFFTLTEDVWQFSPDVVVLAFFPGNDVRNNSAVLEGDKCRPFFVPSGGQFVLGGPFEDSWLFHFQCFMRFESYHSQLLNLLGEARSALRSALRKRRQLANQQHSADHSPEPAANRWHEPGINDSIYRPPASVDWRDAWSVSEAEIEMVERNVLTHRAAFLLVIIGTGVQMLPNASSQADYIKAVGGTDLLYPDRRLRALGERNGFAVLDLVPPMKAYAQANQIYFHGFANTRIGTGHWNQRGNCQAAELIAKRIVSMMTQTQR